MTQNDSDYVIHVHEKKDSQIAAYFLLGLAIVWIVGVVYAIASDASDKF